MNLSVEIKILLPNKSVCAFKINRNSNADEVYKVKFKKKPKN